jgi:hypothetical protein
VLSSQKTEENQQMRCVHYLDNAAILVKEVVVEGEEGEEGEEGGLTEEVAVATPEIEDATEGMNI